VADPQGPDDLHLFREEMADAEPLRQNRTEPFRRPPPPRRLPQPADLREGLAEATLSEAEVVTGEVLDFARPGVQHRVRQQLRAGHLAPQLELDLHGLTVAYAQETLDAFLQECCRRALRSVRIIHGKGYRSEQGQPVLKCKVNYWLRLYDDVLAFTSASRRDGGTGAVYVLLRNPRKGASR
jgi:DNA-nicking Smr family endonuclease